MTAVTVATAIWVAVLAVGLFASPASAQVLAARPYRVAILEPFSTDEAETYRAALFRAMHDLGYVQGRHVTFEVRTSDRDMTRLPALADELIALQPDVFVGNETVAVITRARTTAIPFVLTLSFDPVAAGLAQSLRRPGMNVTGSSLFLDQLAVKHIEIMRDIRPRLRRIGLLFDTTSGAACKVVEDGVRQAARSVGALSVSYRVSNRDEIERAFARMQAERPDVLIPCPMPVLFNNRDLLFERAVRLRIPFTSFVTASLPLGVLLSYSANFAESYRRAATYIDKILKGASPGELPIEQPTRLELVINLKTAREFGITVPQAVLLRADRVVE